MNARLCSIKWRVQFQSSCKIPSRLVRVPFVQVSAMWRYWILNHKQNMFQRPKCCHHVIKELIHAFGCAYIELCTWKVWRPLKKLELLSSIASRNSCPSFMLSKLSASIHNWILFSVRERAELNKSCKRIGSWGGRNFLIRTTTAGGIRRGDLFSYEN